MIKAMPFYSRVYSVLGLDALDVIWHYGNGDEYGQSRTTRHCQCDIELFATVWNSIGLAVLAGLLGSLNKWQLGLF